MDKIDANIGKSIRHYRWLQGISLNELAVTIGITDAQLRSHEAGKSRVSAARLMAIAGHLGVDVAAFFQRNPDVVSPPTSSDHAPARSTIASVQNGKYLAVLMTHFQRLNETQKQAVLQLVVSISKEGSSNTQSGQDLRDLITANGQSPRGGGRDGPY